jgi:glyoxylase-like metal-dependent hydrolase (beta-lactamase superfamily II)
MNIPIEDNFTDVIGKAQCGLRLDDAALAERAGISVGEVQALKYGKVDESAMRKVATVLSIGGDALLALAQGSYIPRGIPEIEGLAHCNTVFGDMTVNSFVVWDPASREAAFFDTGADGDPMLDTARKHNLNVTQILLTHTHGDHVLDLDRLKERTKARAYVCEKEPLDGAESFAPGRAFAIGKLTVETRLTSGHSAGGITYFICGLSVPLAIVGDSIFAGSMGGGMVSYDDALRNSREQILTLPDETVLCPGHGPLTTVGEQKRANPFFAI